MVAASEVEGTVGQNGHKHIEVRSDFLKVAVARGKRHQIRS